MKDAEVFFQNEYSDFPDKLQAYRAISNEEKRISWNEINTSLLQKLLQIFGFRYVKLNGNYGKDEISFVVMTPLVGSQQIAAMSQTEVIQILQAIGGFFKQDSVLFSRFKTNIYLFTYGERLGKIVYGESYHTVDPGAPYSSWLTVKKNGLDVSRGFSLRLNWDIKKELSQFIEECDHARDNNYLGFSTLQESQKACDLYKTELSQITIVRLNILTKYTQKISTELHSLRKRLQLEPRDFKGIELEANNMFASLEFQAEVYAQLFSIIVDLYVKIEDAAQATSLQHLLCALNEPRTYQELLTMVNQVIHAIQFELIPADLIIDDQRIRNHQQSTQKKLFIMTRGLDEYNQLGQLLIKRFAEAGLNVAAVSSDAHINRIGEEYPWYPFESCILTKMLARNEILLKHYLSNDQTEVLIYCDMNRNLAYMLPHVKYAEQHGFEIVCVLSSFDVSLNEFYYLQHHLEKFDCIDDTATLSFSGCKSVPQLQSTIMRSSMHHFFAKSSISNMPIEKSDLDISRPLSK